MPAMSVNKTLRISKPLSTSTGTQ
uniref:Uncharacterized protein n=1 Tax=Lepeophtheirus salmonis TaxID=72036 RepID=A0A0K2V5G8_LEPSM